METTMDRTTNNNPSNRTIFFIIERINSPPFTGRPFKSHAIYFPFVFSYLVRSISKSFIGARFLPRLFTPASSLFDETISKLNEISKARSNVYEQGDRGRTINVIPTRDRKLYLFNGARFARFSSPFARINERRRKETNYPRHLVSPPRPDSDLLRIRFEEHWKEGRFGFDTRANWIPVFDSFASRCPENYARTTIDSFFELHKHSFPSSSNEIFHLPLLADTSDFSNLLHGSRFYREMPRHFMEAFFLCDRSLADGTNNGSTPHPLTRQTSKIENTGIRRRKRAVVIDWWM